MESFKTRTVPPNALGSPSGYRKRFRGALWDFILLWLGAASTPYRMRAKMSSGEGHRGSQRPHVELTIHWSSRNKQRVTALADTLNVPKYDNFQKLCGSLSGIDSYGGQTVTVKVPHALQSRCSHLQKY